MLTNNSHTSFDMDCDQQSVQYSSYQEYIQNLKSNNKVISMALKKAEDLIYEYQHENEELKSKNKELERKLVDLEDQVEYLKQILMKDNGNKMEDKVTDLTIRNQRAQKKVYNLMEELEKSEAKVAKLTRFKQQKAQKSLHNFFEFASPKNTKNASKQEQLAREIRSLKWKLEQREQEITYMIKKNKLLEQKNEKNFYKGNSISRQYKKFGDDSRLHTCQTQPNKGYNG